MDIKEKQLWCRAWRFLKQHGEQSEHMIEREIEESLKRHDAELAQYWRNIAKAIDELRN
jgi:hypothetical protein